MILVAEVLAAKAVETFTSNCQRAYNTVAEVLAAKAVETILLTSCKQSVNAGVAEVLAAKAVETWLLPKQLLRVLLVAEVLAAKAVETPWCRRYKTARHVSQRY